MAFVTRVDSPLAKAASDSVCYTCGSNVTKVLQTSFLKENVIERRILAMTFFDSEIRLSSQETSGSGSQEERQCFLRSAMSAASAVPAFAEDPDEDLDCSMGSPCHQLVEKAGVSVRKNRSAFTSDREHLTGP